MRDHSSKAPAEGKESRWFPERGHRRGRCPQRKISGAACRAGHDKGQRLFYIRTQNGAFITTGFCRKTTAIGTAVLPQFFSVIELPKILVGYPEEGALYIRKIVKLHINNNNNIFFDKRRSEEYCKFKRIYCEDLGNACEALDNAMIDFGKGG